RFTHISGGILVHSSLQILSKSLRLRFQWEGMRFKPNIPHYMAPSSVPSMQWSRPVPLAEKQPQSIVSTSMLDGGDGVIFSILPPPNAASRVDAKELEI